VAGWRRLPIACTRKAGASSPALAIVGRISHTSLQAKAARRSRHPRSAPRATTFVGGTFAGRLRARAGWNVRNPGHYRSFRARHDKCAGSRFRRRRNPRRQTANLLEQFAKDGTNKRTDAYGGGSRTAPN